MTLTQKTHLFLLVVLCFFFLPTFSAQASNFSQTLNFQGKLKDTGSSANGTYNIKFELCSNDDCSSVIWTEYHDTANAGQVTVTNGIFNTILGTDVTLVGVDLDQTLYLRITVDGTGASPSYSTPVGIIALGMTPAAREADSLDGLDSLRFGILDAGFETLSFNGANVLTVDQEASYENIFLGTSGGRASVTGGNNIFIGKDSGRDTTSGLANIFVGSSAGQRNTTGGGNYFAGFATGANNTSGSSNMFLGNYAGFSNSSGSYNIYIGRDSGYSNATGTSNIFLGDQAGYFETGSNRLYVDNSSTTSPLIYGEFDNDIVRINGTLEVGSQLEITGPGTGNIFVGDNAGNPAVSGSNNVVLGREAGTSLTSASGAVIIGYQAGANHSAPTGGQNVYIGRFAGASGGTAHSNTYVGDSTGRYSSGSLNTFLGNQAGLNNTSGAGNTLIGANAGEANLTGQSNSILGYRAGGRAVNLERNVLLGVSTLDNATASTTDLVALGYRAAYTNTTADRSVLLGSESGYLATSSTDNVFIGYQSGYNETGSNKLYIENSNSATPLIYGEFDNNIVTINGNLNLPAANQISLGATDIFEHNTSNIVIGTGGDDFESDVINNTFLGYQAGENTDGPGGSSFWIGGYNTFIGAQAGQANIDGDSNTFVGALAAFQFVSGLQNTLIGEEVADDLLSGSDNTFLGRRAGDGITSGSSNIIIGSGVTIASSTANNQLNIGGILYGDLAADRLSIGSADYENLPSSGLRIPGGVMIGATSTDSLIDDASNGSGSATLYVGNETIDTTVSDQRLKTNITNPTESALTFLSQFDIKAFEWLPENPRHDYGAIPFGLLAQEVKTIAPQYIRETSNPEDYISVRFADLVPALISAVQELSETVGGGAAHVGNYVTGIYEGLVQFGRGILTPKVVTTELCVGDICVTEDDFRDVFGGAEPQALGASAADKENESTSAAESPFEIAGTSTEPLATNTDSGLGDTPDITEQLIEPIAETQEETGSEESAADVIDQAEETKTSPAEDEPAVPEDAPAAEVTTKETSTSTES